MPGRKGVPDPKNSFLDTIATRFNGTHSCFILASAQIPGLYPIVYCSDGFCELTGHGRGQVMQKCCTCEFMYGEDTSMKDRRDIWHALAEKRKYQTTITLYKRNGAKYDCLLDIVPIKNPRNEVDMFLVSFKETTSKNSESEGVGIKPLLQHSSESESPLLRNGDANAGEEKEIQGNLRDRRRSRAVLYNLSGHIKEQKKSERSLSNIFTSASGPVLEYMPYFSKGSRFIILHYCIRKHVWDWLIFLFTLYAAASVPYYAALRNISTVRWNSTCIINDNFSSAIYFDILLEFFFIVDIVVNFRTTFVNNAGQVVSEPKTIAIHYFRSIFIIDFIAGLPLDTAMHLLGSGCIPLPTPVQVLKFVRLLRVVKLLKILDHWSQYRVVVLFLLMLMFVLVAHWMACIWFILGWTEIKMASETDNIRSGWMHELGSVLRTQFNSETADGPEITTTYITSLYFTLSSLTSVGFGNVSPNTNNEKIFSICVMLIGAIMHAVVFGSITAIIQQMYKTRSEYDRKERGLKDFMRMHRLSKELHHRVIQNFQGQWLLNNGVDQNEIMKDFSKSLQTDVFMHLYKDILSLSVFDETSEGCRRFLSSHVSPQFATLGDVFIRTGDPIEHIYLVCSGSFEVLKNELVVALLSKGDLFGGDVSSDKVITSEADVKALTFCELQCLSMNGLRKVNEIYPEYSNIIKEDLRNEFSYRLWEPTSEIAEDMDRQPVKRFGSWNAQHMSDSTQQSYETKQSDNWGTSERTTTNPFVKSELPIISEEPEANSSSTYIPRLDSLKKRDITTFKKEDSKYVIKPCIKRKMRRRSCRKPKKVIFRDVTSANCCSAFQKNPRSKAKEVSTQTEYPAKYQSLYSEGTGSHRYLTIETDRTRLPATEFHTTTEHRPTNRKNIWNGGISYGSVNSVLNQIENGNLFRSTSVRDRLSLPENLSACHPPKYVDVRSSIVTSPQVDMVPTIAVNGEIHNEKKNYLSVRLQEAAHLEIESGYNTEGSPHPEIYGSE